ncbi:uncharacterized protein [Salminus brasiliensis]|uniref:uncharacterized protein n=1 Tax=Salminus brasiliensis TaxID=930266 RepID=UPI003B836236
MSQDDYENVCRPYQRGDRMEMVVDIYESADAVRAPQPTRVKKEDTSTHGELQTQHTGGNTAGSRRYRPAAVCLGLLCVFLLTAITLLLISFINLTAERDQLQTSYTNLTAERDRLQTSNTNLTAERDRLQTSNTNLTAERDQLQTSNTNLTAERDQLHTSYNQLRKERDQLQTSYTNMTKEKDQLQTSYNQLRKEKNQLQTSNTNLNVKNVNLIKERDQIQTSNTRLTAEKDQLQTSNTRLTAEKDQLQTSNTRLTAEKDQLQTSNTRLTAERDQLQGERDELQKRLCELMLHQGWRRFRSSLYSITTEKTGWSGTRNECQRRGGDLVIINSREEQEFLNKEFGSSEAWIGLSDSEKEGEWKWVNGSALTTKFWWGKEPNDYGGNEDCAVTGYNGATPGAVETWADFPCLHSTVGICEKPLEGCKSESRAEDGVKALH